MPAQLKTVYCVKKNGEYLGKWTPSRNWYPKPYKHTHFKSVSDAASSIASHPLSWTWHGPVQIVAITNGVETIL